MFFVISGYLITSLLIAEYSQFGRLSFWHFYRRRFARLAPALLLVCIITISILLLIRAQLDLWAWGAVGALTYTTDIISGYIYTVRVGESFPYTWSLGVEEQFYLLWPVILLFLLRLDRLLPALTFLVVGIVTASGFRYLQILSHTHPTSIAFAPSTHADALLWGCGIGIVLATYPTSRALKRISQIVGPLGVVVLVVIVVHGHLVTMVDQYGLSAVAATAVVAWVALDPNGWFGRILSFAPLAFLGRLSYGIYLWNILLLLAYRQLVHTTPAMSWWGLVWVASTVAMAYLSYRFVEQPLRKRWAPPQSHAIVVEPTNEPATRDSPNAVGT